MFFRQISESRDASLSRSNSNQTLCWNTRGSNQNLAGPDFTNLTAQVRSLNYVCCISCTCISELIRLRANIGEKKPIRVFSIPTVPVFSVRLSAPTVRMWVRLGRHPETVEEIISGHCQGPASRGPHRAQQGTYAPYA